MITVNVCDVYLLCVYVYTCECNNYMTFICSDGCGRTGVYIAISILLERLKTEGVVDVFHTVRTLRHQRSGMVESYVRHLAS